jgi:DNA polymerase elongation subunit (family B)
METMDKFQALLETEGVDENDCQDFLERHTDYLFTPFMLNHGILHNSIISKFPLDTSLITDFVYVAKSSDVIRIVLVEIENPKKSIFRKDSGSVIQTAEFTQAYSQILSWKEFVSNNKDEILRRLKPLLKSFIEHAIEFKYYLVIGRKSQSFDSHQAKQRLQSLQGSDIHICTYDSLLSAKENQTTSTLSVIKLEKMSFTLKYLKTPTSLLSYLFPHELNIAQDQIETLKNEGYQVDDWSNGKLLSFNRKYSSLQQLKDTWKQN